MTILSLLGYYSVVFGGLVLYSLSKKEDSKVDAELGEKRESLSEFIKKTNLKINDDYAYCYKIESTDEFDYYYISLADGMSFSQLEKSKEAFENHFKKDIRIEKHNYNYIIIVDKRKKSILKKRYDFEVVEIKDKSTLSIVVGMTADNPLIFNLSNENPHIILCGTSGSGKSRLQKSILLSLIENYSPNELELVYLDNKGTEVGAFKSVKHLIHRTNNIYSTVDYLDELEREMYRRNKLIEAKDVTNIVDYNKKVNEADKMKFRFVVIDELFPLLTLPPKEKTAAYSKLALLMSMSRSSGIHILISLQKSTTDLLPSMISANAALTLGLRVRNAQESKNLGTEGLELIPLDLKGRGQAIADRKQEFQSFWVTDDVIRNICNKYKTDKKTVKSNVVAFKNEDGIETVRGIIA